MGLGDDDSRALILSGGLTAKSGIGAQLLFALASGILQGSKLPLLISVLKLLGKVLWSLGLKCCQYTDDTPLLPFVFS